MSHIYDPDDAEVRIRIFGSAHCDKCDLLKKLFTSVGIEFDFIDANDNKNDIICDLNNVDELPHIQAYRVRSKKIIVNYKGFISPKDLIKKMKDALSDRGKNVQINGRSSNEGSNCGSCGKS